MQELDLETTSACAIFVATLAIALLGHALVPHTAMPSHHHLLPVHPDTLYRVRTIATLVSAALPATTGIALLRHALIDS